MNELIQRLENINPDDVSFFSFDEIETYAKVFDVYDGDSIKIVFIYKDIVYKYKCRIYGIDTPEIQTKDLVQKELGKKAKDYLKTLILNK